MTMRPTRDNDRSAGISCAATRARGGPDSNQDRSPTMSEKSQPNSDVAQDVAQQI